MNFNIWHSKLLQLWHERNGYLILAVGLLLTNFVQLGVVISLVGHWRTILVPANLSQRVWLSQSTVSESYLVEMTYYFAKLVLDVTPSSAAFQRETLLHYVDPGYYGALKNQLIAQEEKIKSNVLSTSFYPVDIKTDDKKKVAIITGDLHTFIGELPTSSTRQSYLVRYRYTQGRLLLQQFSEVKREY